MIDRSIKVSPFEMARIGFIDAKNNKVPLSKNRWYMKGYNAYQNKVTISLQKQPKSKY